MRVVQKIRTFGARSSAELDEKISKCANEMQMLVKSVSLAVQDCGFSEVWFYATVVYESINEEENDD